MKVKMNRMDALRGAHYAVSIHLHEGTAAEDIKERFPDVTCILYKDSEEPEKLEVLRMLEDNEYRTEKWDGTCPAANTALLTWGDMDAMEREADALTACGVEADFPHLWWMSVPEAAFQLPRVGVRHAALTFCDPTYFPAPRSDGWQAAVVYAVRLGVLLDKGLFQLVYASYDPVTLCARGCRLVQDLVASDPSVGDRLGFGSVMARVIDRVTGCELTQAESTAIGMLREVRLGARLGLCNPRRLTDLEGVLAYHGLPNDVEATSEEMQAAFAALYGDTGTVNLTLPTAIGKCREKAVPCTDIIL